MSSKETEFKQLYVATFLATYMAVRYDKDCNEGHKDQRYQSQPVEDARFLADCAWDSLQKK